MNIFLAAKTRLQAVTRIGRTGLSLGNIAWLGVLLLIRSMSTGNVLSQTIPIRSYTTLITIPSEQLMGGEVVAVPYAETFDEYPTNFSFTSPTNGWVTGIGNESSVIAASSLPVIPPGPPVFSDQCLRLDTQGELFSLVSTSRADNIWIDMSVLMIGSDDSRSFPSKSQLGLRLLGVYDDYHMLLYQHLAIACGLTNEWMASSPIFSTDTLLPFKITLQIANADHLTIPYFRVFLDGTNVIWSAGFSLPDVPSEGGGAWLPCMTTNRAFYGIGFDGTGYVDEIRISDSNLGPIVPYQATIGQAVAISWPSDYGQRYQVETRRDLTVDDWEPFGEPVIGNGTTNTVFEDMGSSTRKFYRVVPLQ